jgi:hypothetical protein
MSDQNKYVNTYIETMMASLHENLATILQLKTQLRLTNEIIQEKDRVIQSLNVEIENLKRSDADYHQAKDNAKIWEESFRAMERKVSHMDTLMNQVKEMKKMVLEKDKEIESLKQTINKRKRKVTEKEDVKQIVLIEQVKETVEETEKQVNDF